MKAAIGLAMILCVLTPMVWVSAQEIWDVAAQEEVNREFNRPELIEKGRYLAVAGDCRACHEPHGSSNPMALKRSRVDQLCLECHSPIEGGTLGPQPPAIHDLFSPRYRNCTTCHVAIHGSNTSPALLK